MEALPRKEVTSFLEKQDLDACSGYLEHIINELGETGADFHDKLAEIYLSRAATGFSKAKKGGPRNRCTLHNTDCICAEEVPESYTSFLKFLMESTHYRPYRLITKVDENSEYSHLRVVGWQLTSLEKCPRPELSC